MEFKNNFYLPPMAMEGSINGKPDPFLTKYYEDMAIKGFGLIVLEHAYVDIYGKASPKQMSIDENYDKKILTEIRMVIQKHGAKAVMQISHAGRNAKGSEIKFGASKENGVYELSTYDIKELEEKFLQSALRVKDMGYDAVEIHSAHGYLLNQFFSPVTNKRNDEYGGSIENRLRFLTEILEKIKREIPEYPIIVRLGACDYVEGGNEIDEAVKASKILEKYIDYIDVSGGVTGFLKHSENELGYFTKEAEEIKENTNLIVLMAGGIKTKEEAQQLIDEKLCDMVGIGRAALRKDFKL